MRSFDSVFLVDEQPMLVPDAGVELGFHDIDAASAGRDEAGYMHRIPVRTGVRTWSFQYGVLTEEEAAYLRGLFAGKATFTFAFDGGQTTAYCSRQELTLWNRARGLCKGMKFDIIEC